MPRKQADRDEAEEEADDVGEDEELPEEGQRFLKHVKKAVRGELQSVLDERLHVESKTDKTDEEDNSEGDGDGASNPPPGRSFMERIGW